MSLSSKSTLCPLLRMFLSHRWSLSGDFLCVAGYWRSVFMDELLGTVPLWRWAWGAHSDSDTATGMWVGALGTGSWAAAREFRAGHSEAGSVTGGGSGIGSWLGWFRFVVDTLVLNRGDGVLNTDSWTDKEPLHRLHLQYSWSLYAECDWCVHCAVGSLSRYFGYSQLHVETVPTFWFDSQHPINASKKRSYYVSLFLVGIYSVNPKKIKLLFYCKIKYDSK